MYAILLMKSLATGSIIYFFTLFPFKHFYPSFVEIFLSKSRQNLSRLILSLAAYVCRKHVRAKMICWHHHKMFWLVPRLRSKEVNRSMKSGWTVTKT